MLRTIFGYAILAIIGFFAIKLLLGLLGFAVGLLINLLWLAAIGFVIYLVVKVVSPATAQKVHDTIKGRRHAA
jgi:uncharacterized membrane protein